jgi:predicted O-linked N-acetylglucosamine transferase (SPINDLY family)
MLRPDQAILLAIQHQQAGRLADAEEICRQILAQQPNHGDALHVAGVIAGQRGQLHVAIDFLRGAVAVFPNAAECRLNLGVALAEAGQAAEAVEQYRHVLRLSPQHRAASINLAHLLTLQGDLDAAAEASSSVIQLDPGSAEAFNNLANVRKDQGLLDEALSCYGRAIALKPADPVFHSNRIYLLHFHPRFDAAAILAEHREWNRRHAAHLRPGVGQRSEVRGQKSEGGGQKTREGTGRLRIGYVSPNFRTHPVGRFLLPLLRQHDRAGFEIFCYCDVRRPDALTERFRGMADHWRDTARMSDEELARLIRADGIDILVDLTMHMVDNRLLVFARKPAPMQVTYLAYCSTTGLETIDYRFTDPYLDPPGVGDEFYSEKSFRLPETYWCYEPGLETPEVGPLPALVDAGRALPAASPDGGQCPPYTQRLDPGGPQATGQITFGCLNTFSKGTEAALRCWCRLLRDVPRSRLLLHAKEGGHRQRVIELLKRENVNPNRLGFVGFLPGLDYFRLYQGIDIALDPFPCAGGTTTCDALWMGVPVVSLAGSTAVSRAGMSILSNVGLPELVAHSQEEYVAIAAALAADRTRLAQLRAGLRERMRQSPLMDAPRFARNIEEAFREMWRFDRGCHG